MADEQPNPFAMYGDLERHWHTLTPNEQAQANELLLDASKSIRSHMSVYPETREESWWTAHRRGLEIVYCQIVCIRFSYTSPSLRDAIYGTR